MTSGATQVSILGPDLWNGTRDGLIQAETPGEALLVRYANVVAELIAARTVEFAQFKLNNFMHTVNAWMGNHDLTLALSKMEIVELTK